MRGRKLSGLGGVRGWACLPLSFPWVRQRCPRQGLLRCSSLPAGFAPSWFLPQTHGHPVVFPSFCLPRLLRRRWQPSPRQHPQPGPPVCGHARVTAGPSKPIAVQANCRASANCFAPTTRASSQHLCPSRYSRPESHTRPPVSQHPSDPLTDLRLFGAGIPGSSGPL